MLYITRNFYYHVWKIHLKVQWKVSKFCDLLSDLAKASKTRIFPYQATLLCRVVGQHKVCLLCTQLGLMGVVDKAAASFQLVKAHELEEDYSSISSSSSAKFFLFPRCRRSRSCSRSEVYYVLRQARGRRWRRPNKLRAFFLCKARTAFTSMKKTSVCDFGLFLA